ncbi:hypothetical protein AS156_36505 [Bradyrhizobium macuxiense]|uniref:Uncharacterized protein n=1 Tax=Bradyrhizobium macuxiense TaxID=1755647 RepID=A0A120FQB6_9BRAD|nr:hypothetical protein AS156_36505 [Bradyrhizobium macuxiense]
MKPRPGDGDIGEFANVGHAAPSGMPFKLPEITHMLTAVPANSAACLPSVGTRSSAATRRAIFSG